MARSRGNTIEREIGRELDVLKTHLVQLTGLVEQYGEKKGADVAASLSDKAQEFLDQARSTSTYLSDNIASLLNGSGAMAKQARDLASHEIERVETAVAERPLTSLACAIGAGVAIGWLLGRR
ncbi:hypothetical protein [Desertibaculum subflavum]|uniref:hypothetical protein n=1 Tax=Desertibaculum subflavum TaxID=2268458 RepID=UPI000E66AA52